MTNSLNQYYATDKDLFDALMSGKQRLTEGVLREFARDRGIFFSPKDSRDELADKLSLLPHALDDITGILHRREHARRGEKTTSIVLGDDLAIDELKTAVADYQMDVGSTEKVASHQKGTTGYVVGVEYDEIDYSRTHLIQRQRHNAEIEFVKQGNTTLVRLPATDKAGRIVAALKDKIEKKRKAVVAQEVIELTGIDSPEDRTAFFTNLIRGLEGYRLRDVTNLKVSAGKGNTDEDDDEDEDARDMTAAHEMLAYVKSMALSGQNLTASAQYQQLRKQGFFITSISWSAEQTIVPQDIVEFHAAFEDGESGTGFKYAVKGTRRFRDGQHLKSLQPVSSTEREYLLSLLEETAREVLAELKKASKDDASTANEKENV